MLVSKAFLPSVSSHLDRNSFAISRTAASYSLIGAAQAFCTAFHPETYYFAPIGTASPLINHASKTRLNAAAASALSITIKSLSCRFNPEAEKFAAPVRSNRPSIGSS